MSAWSFPSLLADGRERMRYPTSPRYRHRPRWRQQNGVWSVGGAEPKARSRLASPPFACGSPTGRRSVSTIWAPSTCQARKCGSSGNIVRQASASTTSPTCLPTRRSSNWPARSKRLVCEQAHQQLKEELGLDHFQGQSWKGLHRHALMSMIALAFLQSLRLKQAKGRKKNLGPATETELDRNQTSHH